jgi:hypothetical protein
MDNFKPNKKFWRGYAGLYGSEANFEAVKPTVERLARKKQEPKEYEGQIKLVAWARSKDLPLISIPNAGKRSAWQGEKERAMGLTAGVSDLFLARPSFAFHGFWLEMKSKGRKPTPLQEEWLGRMRGYGYKAEYYDDWENAKIAIIDYLADD